MLGRIALCLVKLNLWIFCVLGPTYLIVGLITLATDLPYHERVGGTAPPSAFAILGLATTLLGWGHVLSVKKWQFSTIDLVIHTGWLAITLAVLTQWPSFTVFTLLFAIAAFLRYEQKHLRRDLGLSTTDSPSSKSSPNHSP